MQNYYTLFCRCSAIPISDDLQRLAGDHCAVRYELLIPAVSLLSQIVIQDTSHRINVLVVKWEVFVVM
jgi:hypothetical protein